MTRRVFRVRRYQRAFHEAWTRLDVRRFIEIAHRRWGKDEIALDRTRFHALNRSASYWHCLPEYAQARKALWSAVDPHTGQRRIEQAFPTEIVEDRNEQEMFLRLKNGSTWQLVGSDRFDSLVGAGIAGCVFSEWALANPSAWGLIRPMLEENNGWGAFITTPRGNNHAKSMLDLARRLPDRWFAEVSSVHDTGALSQQQLDEALEEYEAIYGADFGRALFEQEYLCSFSGAMVGAYFGGEMARAEREGRVAACGVDPAHPVHTAWDLGAAHNNPVWCFQVIGPELRVVDFYLPESEDVEDWCRWLDGQGYRGNDYVPHDVLVTEWGSKRTRIETLRALGRKPKRITKVSVADGLQAGRVAINAGRFHAGADDRAQRLAHGIDGLKSYRREWDDELKTFRATPVKDWAEHIGSAWRYLGLAWREERKADPPTPRPTEPVYTARPDGSVVSNMSLREQIEAHIRKRKPQD